MTVKAKVRVKHLAASQKKFQIASNHQKLGKSKKVSTTVFGRALLSQHLDFRLLPSRAVRK